jgi:competence protein ComEA
MSHGKRARALRAGHDLLARAAAARDVVRSRWQAAWGATLAWRWSPLVARCLLGALGLALLAGIGRSALAGGVMSQPTVAPPPAAVTPPSPPAPSRPADAVAAVPSANVPAVSARSAPSATPEDAGASAHAAPSRRATPDDPVILNQAAFEDLRRLPGVGPKRAQAILTLRQRLGRFRQVEDLLKVKGIGRSTLKKLRPLIKLDPIATTAGSSETTLAVRPERFLLHPHETSRARRAARPDHRRDGQRRRRQRSRRRPPPRLRRPG